MFRLEQEQQLGLVYNITRMHSFDVETIINQQPIYFEEHAHQFLKSLGTTLIPTERYA
jgi:hypothetical protein